MTATGEDRLFIEPARVSLQGRNGAMNVSSADPCRSSPGTQAVALDLKRSVKRAVAKSQGSRPTASRMLPTMLCRAWRGTWAESDPSPVAPGHSSGGSSASL